MENAARRAHLKGPRYLLPMLTDEFPEFAPYYNLCLQFLRLTTYDHDFCVKLLALARQADASWHVRRLAVLMLEHQIRKLDQHNLKEFEFLLESLDLRETSGKITKAVLREGYSTTDPRHFVAELQRKLARLDRVHNKINGTKTSEPAMREFFKLSCDDCKLSLARYLFTPEQVVDEIFERLQITDGLRDFDTQEPRYAVDEANRAIKLLPRYEARILELLCRTADVYWVSDDTSAEINSLVEYPLTTVVLVIKPPGSNFEFEIKRAGLRGHNSLNVVFARRGYVVAPSHRLSGGSMQWLLRYETRNATKLSRVYRLVHETEAPIPAYISRSTITSIPVPDDEVQTLTYFTDPDSFGPDFPQMRAAMKQSVAAFKKEGYVNLAPLPGDLGLTAQFIGTVTPGQAILSGTTSFRLDKLDTYLSETGADYYFKRLGLSHSTREGKAFADALLEEILGCYRSPDVPYRNHKQYVSAAFAVPENRERADGIYLSLVRQIAKFWGTLLGVRGYSRGESFVARNVGLRSVWEQGRWIVKIVFMDHDALVLPNSDNGAFFAYGDLHNMRLDERYIWERSDAKRFAESQIGRLQRIYRVSEALDAQGQDVARVALKDAYKKTQHTLLTKPELQRLFTKGVREKLLDFDVLVDGYLRLNGNKAEVETWKKQMKAMLAEKGYHDEAFDVYLQVMEKNRAFLERHSYLFELETKKAATGKRLS